MDLVYSKGLTLSTDPVNIFQKSDLTMNNITRMAFVILSLIFISMVKFDKHLRIRISEVQFRKLADVLILEQRSKSALLRGLLVDYLSGNYGYIDQQGQDNGIITTMEHEDEN